MFDQLLIDVLSDLLEHRQEAISEFELIGILQNPPYGFFDQQALKSDIAMFRCHFILFHCLYRLQQRWIEKQTCFLDIHVTRIVRIDWEEGQLTAGDEKLREYYLDWQNLTSTSEQDVIELLNSFWQQMGKLQRVTDKDRRMAMQTLALQEPLRMSELKAKYRQLMHKNHPDKGGDLSLAQRIDWAYRTLKQDTKFSS